jgi:DNA-binding NtrC family response regulator
LIADDEPKLGRLVAEMLSLAGHSLVHVGSGKEAIAKLEAEPFDLVLTDLKMPEVGGLEVLMRARALRPPPDVVLMTAHGTTESAVAAMRAGAADYLTKPFSMDELRIRIGRLVEKRSAEEVSAKLVDQLAGELVAESKAMKRVLEQAEQVAKTDATVLLLGESGTGKSHLARLIHFKSARRARELVELHCAAVPEALLESELFGHEKGAFTGAEEKKLGHLAVAEGGTILLDEIGEITAATQVKLLRFLQEKEYVPLGSTAARKVDARVVAATNRDLASAIQAGEFREDLYYRLNVFAIEVPPLRERREDIIPLAERILRRRGLPIEKISRAAREPLFAHDWPGNVRELENAIERALILSGADAIEAEHFRSAPASRSSALSFESILAEGFNLDAFERDLIYEAIDRSGGNKAQAARLLGITRRRLYSRLKSLNEKVGD